MSTTRNGRGHVHKRGNTWTAYWRARDEDGRSVQTTKGGFATKRAAEQHLTTMLHQLDTGGYVALDRKTKAETLAQFVRQHWLPVIRRTLRPSTAASYEHWLENHVLPELGSLRFTEITPERINGLYGKLLTSGRLDGKGPLSARSVHHIHVVLHRTLADAVQLDRIARNPADRATAPTPKRREMKVWSSAQLRAFLEHVRDDRLVAAFLVLVTTGMRRSEVLGLRWCDVDLDAGALSINQTLVAVGYELHFSEPKTAKSRRRIGLDPVTVAALKAHRARQVEERLAWGPAWTDTGLVFTKESGDAIHPQSLSQFFENRAKAAGLPAIRLHDLRHSYATAALNAGIPAKVLGERLGHSSIAITSDIYQHVLPEIDDQAAATVATWILEG